MSGGELWFIFSTRKEEWAGLRLATFMKSANQPWIDVLYIYHEAPERAGVRIWQDIEKREEWVKVRKIEMPTPDEIRQAIYEAGGQPINLQ